MLKWTKRAYRSLAAIAAYIARDNPVRAVTFVQEIRAKTELLVAQPGLGRPGRVMGTRELVVHKNYIVSYWVRNGAVEVLQVHHAAQNRADFFDPQ